MSRTNGQVKSKRQQAILQLVSAQPLGSQHEIRHQLAQLGIDATQSTISRDILELGLARVHDERGLRYVIPNSARNVHPQRLRRLMEDFVLSTARTDHGLIIRTESGAAAAVAEAIDQNDIPEIAGTIAGDNTILVIAIEGVGSSLVEAALNQVMEAT